MLSCAGISREHERAMQIAILTFDGFNELDSLIALGILNPIKMPGWGYSSAFRPAPIRSPSRGGGKSRGSKC